MNGGEGLGHGTPFAIDTGMSPKARLVTRLATVASFLLSAMPALADDEPAAAPAEPPAAELPPTTPPEELAPKPEKLRDHGLRLGLELGFARALGSGVERVNAATPSLIPIGAELALRFGPSFMVGIHGYAALASRDDCVDGDACRARAYGVGAHVEATFARTGSWSFWTRYGMGYELVYQGGGPVDPAGHEYRSAFDLIDLRFGTDYVVHRGDDGKLARIGPYLGVVAGTLTGITGIANTSNGNGNPQQRELSANGTEPHAWFTVGVRGTLDP